VLTYVLSTFTHLQRLVVYGPSYCNMRTCVLRSGVMASKDYAKSRTSFYYTTQDAKDISRCFSSRLVRSFVHSVVQTWVYNAEFQSLCCSIQLNRIQCFPNTPADQKTRPSQLVLPGQHIHFSTRHICHRSSSLQISRPRLCRVNLHFL
jgi:hypothetical protein